MTTNINGKDFKIATMTKSNFFGDETLLRLKSPVRIITSDKTIMKCLFIPRGDAHRIFIRDKDQNFENFINTRHRYFTEFRENVKYKRSRRQPVKRKSSIYLNQLTTKIQIDPNHIEMPKVVNPSRFTASFEEDALRSAGIIDRNSIFQNYRSQCSQEDFEENSNGSNSVLIEMPKSIIPSKMENLKIEELDCNSGNQSKVKKKLWEDEEQKQESKQFNQNSISKQFSFVSHDFDDNNYLFEAPEAFSEGSSFSLDSEDVDPEFNISLINNNSKLSDILSSLEVFAFFQ